MSVYIAWTIVCLRIIRIFYQISTLKLTRTQSLLTFSIRLLINDIQADFLIFSFLPPPPFTEAFPIATPTSMRMRRMLNVTNVLIVMSSAHRYLHLIDGSVSIELKHTVCTIKKLYWLQSISFQCSIRFRRYKNVHSAVVRNSIH